MTTVSDVIVDRLRTWGVERIFGYSGDGINGLLASLDTEGAPEFIQTRHEEAAAFMAVGHAKYTGRVGVMLSTQGPGAIHLLNGLYDAKLDRVPVVAIVGQQSRTVLGSGYMQEVNLDVLFSDVASAFLQTVQTPEQVPLVIDRAFRTALAERAPAVIVIPHDVQSADAVDLPQRHGIVHTSATFGRAVVIPQPEDLDAAVSLLYDCERPVVFVGQGARHAGSEVASLADRLGAAIVTSLLGKPHVDERLPNVAGTMGHLGTTASAGVLLECDAIVIVGSNDPWTEFYPTPGQARAIQVDIDARAIGNRYPIDVGLVGDAGPTLELLLRRIGRQPRALWRERVAEHVARWQDISARRAATPARGLNPEQVIRELGARLPDSARIAIDVGSVVYWYARQLALHPGNDAHVSGTLASMGCGIPYAIAAKLADPDRPVIALAGDGGMQMLGNSELATVARMWPSWPDPRFVVCVLDNGDLAEVSWEQRENESSPRFTPSQDLPAFPFARHADSLGMIGIRVQSPADVGPAWDRALSADRPVVLQMATDPDIPLLPPFPAGEAKLESMRAALNAEGDRGRHARELLDVYASMEG